MTHYKCHTENTHTYLCAGPCRESERSVRLELMVTPYHSCTSSLNSTHCTSKMKTLAVSPTIPRKAEPETLENPKQNRRQSQILDSPSVSTLDLSDFFSCVKTKVLQCVYVCVSVSYPPAVTLHLVSLHTAASLLRKYSPPTSCCLF